MGTEAFAVSARSVKLREVARNRDKDFGERLEDAIEAYDTLIGNQNSMTERYFELGHRGDGTCPKCSQTCVRAELDDKGLNVSVCKACGYGRPRGTAPLRSRSPWFTHKL